MSKFIESYSVDDYEVLTPDGWQDIGFTHKTEEYEIWEIETETGKILRCADHHKLINQYGEEVLADELFEGDEIQTSDGLDIVKNIKWTYDWDNMYDLHILSKEHTYYTNDILSHNTTTSMSYILHEALTRPNVKIAILANKHSTAVEVLDRVKYAYECLPWFLQVGVERWNRQSIKLGNGAEIFTASTSSSSIRGKSINIIYLDEFAHILNDTEFYESTYPVISSGKTTQIIITSTPKGLNLFYKLHHDATEGKNKFVTCDNDWTVVPGRDEAWKEETISNTSPQQFAQEFSCEFMGSSETLISGDKLQKLTFSDPINVEQLKENPYFFLYESPKPNKNYVITVDVAEGTGQDYSVATVFDVTQTPFRIVALYRHNLITPIAFAKPVFNLGKDYNDAFITIENNSIGSIVANELFYDFEYENLISSATGMGIDEIGVGNVTPGIRMTKRVKQIGCSTLKSLIESDILTFQSFELFTELSTFSKNGTGSYAADKGKHDDVVMTTVMFAYLTTQPYFNDLFDVNTNEAMREVYEESDNISFMFMTGIDDDDYADTWINF